MPSRGSPLVKFLKDALMSRKYPSSLFWIQEGQNIFGLNCVCKNKKNWDPQYGIIFEDYHNLKARKSDDDKRQRLLVALSKSPFIKMLKSSTKDQKIYQFQSEENNNDNIIEPDGMDFVQAENSTSEMPIENDYYETEDDFLHNMDIAVQYIRDDKDFQTFETEITENLQIPDATLNVAENPTNDILFHDSYTLTNASICKENPYLSNTSTFDLGENETSYYMHFQPLNDALFPSDYDPVQEFQESRNLKLNDLNSERTFCMFKGSPQCEVQEVRALEDNDVLQLLYQNAVPGSPKPSSLR
ncbi:IRF tryptophan pentad repeat domain-containing protein [Caerostris extrusa]|uniref:IRF tryptophan pentad repeat domain-containing protein n=1 Tax=Caerostris extrusa TaxID=172846 RepID=A0AAV4VFL0_CAEEX|nr:IRF tryptophan pentad repeat domain-containing protein [Caerostris extrusa]